MLHLIAQILLVVIFTAIIGLPIYLIVRDIVDKDFREKSIEAYEERKREKAKRKKYRPPLFTDKAFRKYCRTGDRRYLYKDGFRDI